MNPIRLLPALLLIFLGACASTPEPRAWQAEYTQAIQAVKAGHFEAAIASLESLKDSAADENMRYQAETAIAYAFYKKGDYPAALQLTEDIIRRYPPAPRQAYVYFLRGLITLKQGEEEQRKLLAASSASRAYPMNLRKAYGHFTDLIRHFPRSIYTKEAYQQLDYIRELLAEYEVHQIQGLMMQKRYRQAIDRARYVNENFDTTRANLQAQRLMAKAYEALGQSGKAERIRRRLEEREAR